MSEEVHTWAQTNKEVCALLRQAHDMLALSSLPGGSLKRKWVGLTDEEIEARAINFYNPEMYKRAVLWAQEKLKERNQ